MFTLPNECMVHQVLDLKRLPLHDMSISERRRFREAVVELEVTAVVRDSLIPDFVNEQYKVLGIQFISLRLSSLHFAPFVCGVLQKVIKTPAVIYVRDERNECYSFALKRLNMQDANQIVVTEELLTSSLPCGVGKGWGEIVDKYAGFSSAVNRTTLFSWYVEMMVKCYILTNRNVWSGMEQVLSSPVWYNTDAVLELFADLKALVSLTAERRKSQTMSDSLRLNADLKKLYAKIERAVS